MTLKIHVQLDYWFEQPCDALLQVEAAAIPGQVIEQAHITVTPFDHFARVPAQDHIGERIWLRVAGRVLVDYRATVAIEQRVEDCAGLAIVPPHRLPGEAVPYLLPSRYCPSNQFIDFVETTFGAVEGGAKIVAMRDWVAGHLSYVPGSSDTDTTAADTFRARAGVCRDYAHLMIALARAADIPARMASVYALGVTPPDFHAVAEVFLDGGWHLIDPTGMARSGEMAKIGIGRDIGDVAFLTAFGQLRMNSQSVSVETAHR
ncbi:MAG: transglutaminase family protein [Erythrobacter sp.]|nr:transglutaminase family protein [Erythrobacter sp.]